MQMFRQQLHESQRNLRSRTHSVRESGTEPLIRVMVEANDPDDCEKYVEQVVEVLARMRISENNHKISLKEEYRDEDNTDYRVIWMI